MAKTGKESHRQPMLVIGDQEQEAGTMAVRTRENDNHAAMPIGEFLAYITEKASTQSQEL